MQFNELEDYSNNIKMYVDDLIADYKKFLNNLSEIYDIVSRNNPSLGVKVKNLTEEYIDMIKIVSESYDNCANKILEYVKNSNESLKTFASEIKKSAKVLDDILSAMND